MFQGVIYSAILTLLVRDVFGSTMRPGSTPNPGTLTTTATCMVPANVPTSWKKESFPNPQVDITQCGRPCKASWVCDPSRIIKPIDADALDSKIESIAKNTGGKCRCSNCLSEEDGYKIAVAIVPRIELNPFAVVQNVDKDNLAMEFSAYLRSVSWKYGQCDDGIVIFFSEGDRKLFTSTGITAKKVLTNNCTGEIFTEVVPLLKDNRVSEALDHIVTRYGQVLDTGLCHPPLQPVELSVGIIILIVVICVIVVSVAVILSIFGVRRRRGYHRGRTHDPDRTGGRDSGKESGKEDKDDVEFTSGVTGDGGGVTGGSF